MLENGRYLSFEEIRDKMTEQNMDILTLEFTNVIPEMYGYQTIE